MLTLAGAAIVVESQLCLGWSEIFGNVVRELWSFAGLNNVYIPGHCVYTSRVVQVLINTKASLGLSHAENTM